MGINIVKIQFKKKSAFNNTIFCAFGISVEENYILINYSIFLCQIAFDVCDVSVTK